MTTAVDPREVYAAATSPGPEATCGDCRFWFAFSDPEERTAGECRGVPPHSPTGPLTQRGRVCRYPVTLAATPKCPIHQPRIQEP